ncbi:MliC family protein [Crenobacter sp. SG2303]|uniref:MliC family protein n=1 Tax=Crenobacter oryzisoli TaxID=3056844 RepID=A0ABT7XLX0_9NEIS|nr:MliC family protein [Crenobacter sp. SG2303]MDN0074794.1 MliC family protein [Crenobacter sp. SG2303]
MKKTLAVGLALLASLTAFCVSAQAVERGETPFKVNYRCANHRALSVVYPAYADAEHEPIRLTWGGTVYRLHPTEAGSGARYANLQLVWWTKGEAGFLATRGGRMLVRDCHEASSKPVQ